MDYGKLVDELLSQVSSVYFGVRLWDGRQFTYGNGRKKAFTLIFESELAAKRIFSQGALGFGESYMSGDIKIEGSLEAYLKLRHQFKKRRPSIQMTAAALAASYSIPKNPKDQIAYHYDLGNDFFKLFLDRQTMSYSCGLYATGKETLATAQRNKLELVCQLLDLPPNAKVLDLGCGWGGFAVHAAQQYKWDITSVTLSNEQLRYCKKVVASKSLEHKITTQYRDMISDLPEGQFDAIVLLESIEHVGKQRLGTFIAQLYQKLKPGGVVYIQTSGRYKPKRLDRWTLKYVFPGGHLPSQQELVDHASAAGFELKQFVDDRQDYIRTITEWSRRLEENRSTIEAMFDEQLYRLWELWIHGAIVGFEMGTMGLFRIKLERPAMQDS